MTPQRSFVGVPLVALVLVGCARQGQGPAAVPATKFVAGVAVTAARPSLSASSASGDAYAVPPRSAAAARATATGLLDRVHLPAGSVVVDRAPVPALRGDQQPPFPPQYMVSVHRWWTVPGTPRSVVGYLQAHPPTGFGSCTGGCTDGSGASSQLELFADGDDTERTGIGLTVVRDGAEVAVRADGQAIWWPERTTAERVSDEVTGTVRVGGSATRSVKGVGVARLARALNALSSYPPEPASAGCYEQGPQLWVTFVRHGHHWAFHWWSGTCPYIDVSVDDRAQPSLYGSPLPVLPAP